MKKQHTLQFHMDYLMIIHMKKVNDRLDIWVNKMYGGYGKVKTMCWHVQDYIGMTFDLSENINLILMWLTTWTQWSYIFQQI